MSFVYRLAFLAVLTFYCTCGRAQNALLYSKPLAETTGKRPATQGEKPTAPGLYDLGKIVEIELVMHDENWKKKLNFWKKQNLGDRVLATLKVNGMTYDSVGVRLKGNSSYFGPAREDKKKLPFNIKVSETKKGQSIEGKYETLKLSNLFRDPSYLREALSYAIARDYVSAPDCNFARLTVDGDYYGLYNLTESVDEQFGKDEFQSTDGLLVKCDPESKNPPPSTCPVGVGANLTYLGEDSLCYAARYEVKKSDYGWRQLINLTKALQDEKQDLGNHLNVDEALWMLAFNNALANLDSYLGLFCHNYYLFQDDSGIWRPVVWDLNLSIGGFRLVEQNKVLTDEQLTTISPFLHFSNRNEDRPLVLRLLDRPLYRKMYVAHLKTIYEEQMASGLYRKRAEKIRSLITPLVVQEPNPLYPVETYTLNYHSSVDVQGGAVIGIEDFFKRRTEYLGAHPLLVKPTPVIADHSASRDGEKVIISLSLGDGEAAEAVWVAHRAENAGTFRYARLEPVADSNYSVTLPAAQIKDYFLVAEGSISATVLPARSAREWFTVK